MPVSQTDAPDINKDSALERFLAITQIPGLSGDEAAVAKAIEDTLVAAGVDPSNIQYDSAGTRTDPKGNCGNLIVSLPGNGDGPRTMLSAHMDTVPICSGAQPVVDGDEVKSSVATGLGADDRGGCCAILTAVVERMKLGDENFPPAVVGFFVQEEIGLHGARNLDIDMVGKVDRAFNFDGGDVEKIVTGAIGGERIMIKVTGIPSHAGAAPEKGASAIVMASRAIADLDARGWHGKIEKDGKFGTSNVGVFNGGEATNVVTPEVTLRAEARSHDAELRTKIVAEIRDAFEKAASEVKNHEGNCGSVEFTSRVDYEAFRLEDDHPSIAAAKQAIQVVGREPIAEVCNGGLDANWLFRHGIAAVTLGCGQRNIHTADERLDIPHYLDACVLATWLITNGSGQ